MKKVITILFVSLLFSVLSGCNALVYADYPVVPSRAVTEITITFDNGPLHLLRQYDTSEKMQKVLNYLRMLDPYGTPQEDPASISGSHFRIVLSYSDGQEKVYLQKSDRYMKVDGQPWENIPPQKAQELSKLLGAMQSDF